jgi:hypothetical protein
MRKYCAAGTKRAGKIQIEAVKEDRSMAELTLAILGITTKEAKPRPAVV